MSLQNWDAMLQQGLQCLCRACENFAAKLEQDEVGIKELRELTVKKGHLHTAAATEEDSVYRLYYDFNQNVAKLASHQILAFRTILCPHHFNRLFHNASYRTTPTGMNGRDHLLLLII